MAQNYEMVFETEFAAALVEPYEIELDS